MSDIHRVDARADARVACPGLCMVAVCKVVHRHALGSDGLAAHHARQHEVPA